MCTVIDMVRFLQPVGTIRNEYETLDANEFMNKYGLGTKVECISVKRGVNGNAHIVVKMIEEV